MIKPPRGTRTKITATCAAGDNHQVVTVTSDGPTSYRRTPCPTCPWRVDAVGEFPAEAFRYSASTAYDMAEHQFACHQSGSAKPATCAGFLLQGSRHNLATRLRFMSGKIDFAAISNGGHELFGSYREMAEANGVAADDPTLAGCRD